jgi:hypothetical protein
MYRRAKRHGSGNPSRRIYWKGALRELCAVRAERKRDIESVVNDQRDPPPEAPSQFATAYKQIGRARGVIAQVQHVDSAVYRSVDCLQRSRQIGDQMQASDRYSITPSSGLLALA